jgi:hypothetical protein
MMTPRNRHELKGLLGQWTYYRRVISSFADTAKSMTTLKVEVSLSVAPEVQNALH